MTSLAVLTNALGVDSSCEDDSAAEVDSTGITTIC